MRTAETRISVSMIVRDNAVMIRECLESVRPWVDELVVVDTGSKDETPDIARHLGARVFEFPWIDNFSAARNESLRHARGEWLFWMDSDDTLPAECGRRLRELAYGEHEPDTLGYVMQVHCPGPSGDDGDVTVVDHVKMFRNHPDIRFEGRIHEQVLPSIRRLGGKVKRTDIYVVHSGADQSPAGRRRKYERDLRILALELEERPERASFTLFNVGMTYADMGEFATAERHLRRSLEIGNVGESHIRKAFALLVNALSKQAKNDEAWELCQQGRRLFPRDTELRFREAILHHHFGRLEDAEHCYRAAIDEPDEEHFSSVDAGIGSYKARHNLAVVYRDMAYRAAGLNPDQPHSFNHFGRCAETRKWLSHAEAQWRAALDEVPRFRPALRSLGELLLMEGRIISAELEAERLASDESLQVESLLLQAKLAKRAGWHDRERDLLQQAVETAPHDCGVIDAFSQNCFERGCPQNALDVLTDLVERQPDDAATLHNLGLAQLAAAKPAESAESLRRSLHFRPGAPMTHLQLGFALKALGDITGAKLSWREAARLDPDNPAIQQTLRDHDQPPEV